MARPTTAIRTIAWPPTRRYSLWLPGINRAIDRRLRVPARGAAWCQTSHSKHVKGRFLRHSYGTVTKKPFVLQVRDCRAAVTISGTNGAFDTHKQFRRHRRGHFMTTQVVWH